MKPILLRVVFPMLLLACCTLGYGQAQVYVNVRPSWAPPMARPMQPSRAHVWIAEDWVWQGGRYVPAGGRWALPPRPGYIWIQGRWVRSRRGWHWMPGRWRRHY